MARLCVFCGSTPLTREHVFPRWLLDVLPEQERWRGQDMAIVTGEAVNAIDLPIESRQMGERFTDATVVRVCRSCNQGWMNDLESAVRPLVTNLIQGNVARVDVAQADTLAMWVAKTTMMGEFTHPSSSAVPLEHYRWLYEKRLPPPWTQIWALPCDAPNWVVRMQHFGVLYGHPDEVDLAEPCNTYSTTVGLGQVAFHIQGTTKEGLPLPSLDQMPLGAVRLWPDVSAFTWNREAPLHDEDLWIVSDLLRLWLGDDDDRFWNALVRLGMNRAS